MCNAKTMLKMGLVMLAVVGITYVALPDFRDWILAASPTLLFLLCPLSMLFCMKMMHSQNGQSCATSDSEQKPQAPSPNIDMTDKRG
ncbi:DUF2933 domain-containing protein [Noviherbaspirillum suwonense]|uniref:DUF2933 domain-containing protein n=1 Tax=Noviherbaspirillum suwonense TaxID=1224511 RepID=A0ABY1QII6_9BURK|nr:DUF2933 domain-containing protein [Noviherbaspirillum suwonense]SMP72361.1 Protein of unknown function [Noviherbaspirillum suwonense]